MLKIYINKRKLNNNYNIVFKNQVWPKDVPQSDLLYNVRNAKYEVSSKFTLS